MNSFCIAQLVYAAPLFAQPINFNCRPRPNRPLFIGASPFIVTGSDAIMGRTREQEREYRRKYRAEKNALNNGDDNSVTRLALVQSIADGNSDLGDLLASVEAELGSIPAAKSAAPGLSSLALLLATYVQTADSDGGRAQLAAQLRSTLLAVRVEARQVAAPTGKLAAMQAARRG